MSRLRLFLDKFAAARKRGRIPELSPADPDWERVPLPFATDVAEPWIDVIRGSGANDLWLLCTGSVRRKQNRYAFHYDGKAWSPVTDLPLAAPTSVYCVAADDVWVAGRASSLAHWDGSRWTRHHWEGSYSDFRDVFARAGADVWLAAGQSRVIRFDGSDFREVRPAVMDGSNTHELWGTASEVFIPVNASDQPTRIARAAGIQWSTDELGDGGVTLIHGSGPDDIWALSRRNQGWHFDGNTWTRHATAAGPLWSLSVAGPKQAYAVGEDGVVLEWHGERWSCSALATGERLGAVHTQVGGSLLIGGRRLYRRRT